MIGRDGTGRIVFASNVSGDKMRRLMEAEQPQTGYPSTVRPQLTMRHINGPLLTYRNGRVHWLTLRERLSVWIGWDDALSLERRLRPEIGQ